jgi:hypothetical protein
MGAAHEDMRALLDLAVEKGVRGYITLSSRVGIDLGLVGAAGQENRFTQEREELNVSSTEPVLVEILSRGFWRVVIRPARFNPTHIADFGQLRSIVESHRVSERQRSFPYVDWTQGRSGSNWVGQDYSWSTNLETWRLFQSGQFVDFSAIWTDWTERGAYSGMATGNKILPIKDTVGRLTEIFEFAARLALSPAGSDEMVVEIELSGLNGRRLWIENPFSRVRTPTAPEDLTVFRFGTGDIRRTELVTDPSGLAVKAARQLFLRFGLDLREDVLRDLQSDEMGR